MSIIDSLGKVVYLEKLNFINNNHNVDISNLSNGVYSVLIYNEGGKSSQLLIKY
jgi:hypothetical protein